MHGAVLRIVSRAGLGRFSGLGGRGGFEFFVEFAAGSDDAFKGAAITAAITGLASTWLLMWFTQRAGLRLERSTWLITFLPLVLLLHWACCCASPSPRLAIAWTDWLLTSADKQRLNVILDKVMVRRLGRWTRAAN